MTDRQFRQYAQAYGTQPATVHVTLDGNTVYSGTVFTLDEPVPSLPDQSLNINNVAWTWQDSSEFGGVRKLSISVDNSYLLLAETLADNPYAGNIQPGLEWLAFYCNEVDGVKYFNPFSNECINNQLQNTGPRRPSSTGQKWWVIPPGSTFTADLHIDAVEIPTEPPQFKTVIADTVRHWTDMAPTVDLSELRDLNINEKQSALFGRCDIEAWAQDLGVTESILFDTYIRLDLQHIKNQKIFFPSFFLSQCQIFKQQISENWTWPTTRSRDVACAMRIPRPSRFVASCWLAAHQDQVSFAYTQNWDQHQWQQRLTELLEIGGITHVSPVLLPYQAEGELPMDGSHAYVRNFKTLYQGLYQDSAAAAITSAVFWEHGSELCEKYINAVYSGCIPVMHGYGIYDRLSAMGFDTFSDIIDTSSQWETNPVLAAWNMWEQNLDFFANAKTIIQDPAVQDRLRSNFLLIRNGPQLFDNIVNGIIEKGARNTFCNHQTEILNYLNRWHGVDNDPAMRPRLLDFIAGV